jgi:hypothetical protein
VPLAFQHVQEPVGSGRTRRTRPGRTSMDDEDFGVELAEAPLDAPRLNMASGE